MTGTELAVPFAGTGVALTEHARMDGAGLHLAEGATPEELMRVAEGLGMVTDATCFAVGDMANFLRAKFPAEYRLWVDREKPVKGLDRKTVLVYAGVCTAFPHDVRVRFLTEWPGLSFSHFSRVRRYGAQLAEYWLERACTEQLSLNQLDELLEAGTPGSDDVPALPANPATARGDYIWLGPPEDPGRHLLYCGDCTDATAVLTGINAMGAKASMIWTDPPYGVEYVGKTEDALTIQNDGADDLLDLLTRAWAAATPILEESAPFYVAGPTGDNAGAFIESLHAAGWRYKQLLVWVKNTMVLGRQDHQLRHEGIFYGNGPGRIAGRNAKDAFRWYGGDNVTSVFFVDKPPASRDHPTMKPVKLIIPGLENCSRPGEIVYDPFSGSGSTLVAADQLGRRCFAIEYDPAYADVIRRRYEEYLRTRAALGIQGYIEGVATETEAAPTFPGEE